MERTKFEVGRNECTNLTHQPQACFVFNAINTGGLSSSLKHGVVQKRPAATPLSQGSDSGAIKAGDFISNQVLFFISRRIKPRGSNSGAT